MTTWDEWWWNPVEVVERRFDVMPELKRRRLLLLASLALIVYWVTPVIVFACLDEVGLAIMWGMGAGVIVGCVLVALVHAIVTTVRWVTGREIISEDAEWKADFEKAKKEL